MRLKDFPESHFFSMLRNNGNLYIKPESVIRIYVITDHKKPLVGLMTDLG